MVYNGKRLPKRMIWWYPHFRKPPYNDILRAPGFKANDVLGACDEQHRDGPILSTFTHA